jgi:hypothetical protein
MKCFYCGNEITKPLKTLQQLRYYYGVVLVLLAEHFGYDKHEIEQCHEALKALFDTTMTVNKITGEEVIRVWSCKTATKQRMIEYIDWLVRFAAENGVIVPQPEEYFEK